MSFEVEVKYRGVDHERLARLLVKRGASPRDVVEQEDVYFNHPARDFALTNEALRVRRAGDQNRITYKGARRSGPTKTREEIEIALAEGPASSGKLLPLLEVLGFRPVATIRKRRETFHVTYLDHELEVALDLAEGLGAFAEIEAFAHGEADLPAAQHAVLALASELGLTDVEPRSYLRMFLEERNPGRSHTPPPARRRGP
jgi:adenylate cyclase class 2